MTGYSFNLSERGRNGINRPLKPYKSIAYDRLSVRRAVLYPLSYGREPPMRYIPSTRQPRPDACACPGSKGAESAIVGLRRVAPPRLSAFREDEPRSREADVRPRPYR